MPRRSARNSGNQNYRPNDGRYNPYSTSRTTLARRQQQQDQALIAIGILDRPAENEEPPLAVVPKHHMGLGRRNYISVVSPEETSFLKMAFTSIVPVLSPYKIKPPLEPFQQCWKIMGYLAKVVENVMSERNPLDMAVSESDLLTVNSPFLNIMRDQEAQNLFVPICLHDHRLVTRAHDFILKVNKKLTMAVISEITTEIKSAIGLISGNPLYSKVSFIFNLYDLNKLLFLRFLNYASQLLDTLTFLILFQSTMKIKTRGQCYATWTMYQT